MTEWGPQPVAPDPTGREILPWRAARGLAREWWASRRDIATIAAIHLLLSTLAYLDLPLIPEPLRALLLSTVGALAVGLLGAIRIALSLVGVQFYAGPSVGLVVLYCFALNSIIWALALYPVFTGARRLWPYGIPRGREGRRESSADGGSAAAENGEQAGEDEQAETRPDDDPVASAEIIRVGDIVLVCVLGAAVGALGVAPLSRPVLWGVELGATLGATFSLALVVLIAALWHLARIARCGLRPTGPRDLAAALSAVTLVLFALTGDLLLATAVLGEPLARYVERVLAAATFPVGTVVSLRGQALPIAETVFALAFSSAVWALTLCLIWLLAAFLWRRVRPA